MIQNRRYFAIELGNDLSRGIGRHDACDELFEIGQCV
jgi:hypothetical protein